MILEVQRITYDTASRTFKKRIVDALDFGFVSAQLKHNERPWWPVNLKTGKVVRFYPWCAVEFDGNKLRKVADYISENDYIDDKSDAWHDMEDKIPSVYFLDHFPDEITSTTWSDNPLSRDYWNRLPEDNIFCNQTSGNTYQFYHIHVDTYEITCRELTILPENEYQVRDIEYGGDIISFTAFRYDDSHIVSGTVDFAGNVTFLTDSEGTYAVSNFLKLN